MNGTVPRPRWPAPAAKTVTQSKPTRQQEQPPVNSSNRITLAVLDEHSLCPEHAQGYDPYNASASRRLVDAWRRKPKRD